MAKMMNWLKVSGELKKRGLLIFRPWELAQLFGASKTAINFFVYRNTKKGLLVRIKKSRKGSLYALTDYFPSQYLIANRLYEPSYISFDTALSFHGVIPETIYGVTSATAKATREFEVAGTIYKYFRIKKEVFTGFKPVKYENSIIFMAEPEKALADYLYFVDLKKRGLHYERINIRKLKRNKLSKYIGLYNRPGMKRLIKDIYVNAGKPARIY